MANENELGFFGKLKQLVSSAWETVKSWGSSIVDFFTPSKATVKEVEQGYESVKESVTNTAENLVNKVKDGYDDLLGNSPAKEATATVSSPKADNVAKVDTSKLTPIADGEPATEAEIASWKAYAKEIQDKIADYSFASPNLPEVEIKKPTSIEGLFAQAQEQFKQELGFDPAKMNYTSPFANKEYTGSEIVATAATVSAGMTIADKFAHIYTEQEIGTALQEMKTKFTGMGDKEIQNALLNEGRLGVYMLNVLAQDGLVPQEANFEGTVQNLLQAFTIDDRLGPLTANVNDMNAFLVNSPAIIATFNEKFGLGLNPEQSFAQNVETMQIFAKSGYSDTMKEVVQAVGQVFENPNKEPQNGMSLRAPH